MWTILIIFLFCFSVYLPVKLKFQNYKINIKELIRNDKTSLYLTLGTKVGVGSIIGTTSSIIIGGFSSVIWIILFSILTTSIIYYEAYLGRKNRVKLNNDYIGGPNFIVKNKLLSFISLILLLLIYTFMFQMIQMNTISNMILLNVNISKKLILIVFLIILLVTINLKIKEILKTKNEVNFIDLFDKLTKDYVVVTFLSILEMSKNKEIEIKQDNNFGNIIIKEVKE